MIGPVKGPALTLQGRAIGTALLLAAFVVTLIAVMIRRSQDAEASRDIFSPIKVEVVQSMDAVRQSSTWALVTKTGAPALTITASNDEIVAGAPNSAKPTAVALEIKENDYAQWQLTDSVATALKDSKLVPESCKVALKDADAMFRCSQDWANSISPEAAPSGKYPQVGKDMVAWYAKGPLNVLRSDMLSNYLSIHFNGLVLRSLLAVYKGWLNLSVIWFLGLEYLILSIIGTISEEMRSDVEFWDRYLDSGKVTVRLDEKSGRELRAIPDLPNVVWGDQRLISVPQDHDGQFSLRLDLTLESSEDEGSFFYSLFLGTDTNAQAIATGGGAAWNAIPVDRGRLYLRYQSTPERNFDMTKLVFFDWNGDFHTFNPYSLVGPDDNPPKFACRTQSPPPRGITKSLICGMHLNPSAPDNRYRVRITQTANTQTRHVTFKGELYTAKYNELIATNSLIYSDNGLKRLDLNNWDFMDRPKGWRAELQPYYRFLYPLKKDSHGRVRLSVKDGIHEDGGTFIIAHDGQYIVPQDAKAQGCDMGAIRNWYSCGPDCKEQAFDCYVTDRP